MSSQVPSAPVFGVVGSDEKYSRTGMISLVDIFDDFLFSGNDKQLPAKEEGMNMNQFLASNNEDYDDDEEESNETDEEGRPRKRAKGSTRVMTDQQRTERRERNREHAKRSRVRKKFLLESLQHSVRALEEENEKLKNAIKEHLRDEAESLLAVCSVGGPTVIAMNPQEATTTLDDPDYSLVKALQTAQQNFVISDPSLPDNPIVYASQGFLTLTGYVLSEVLGRNCRFLQGPETDPKSVDKIRRGIEKGEDTTVILLNYRKDGSTFWNQFFIAALRDGDGNIVNYLGVQCQVSDDYARAYIQNEPQK